MKTVNQEVKGQLAKLLATENLFIEHQNVSTAAFDVEQRILYLPIWKNITGDIYDLLVGHEVGHALYTPSEVFVSKIPKSFINVVEDARIEKLIKRRYPGLTRNFYRGYNQLHERDFFEVKDQPVDRLSFIDRINLYYKIGLHNNYQDIKFTEEEQVYVDMVGNIETFEEAVDVATKIYEFSKQKEEDKEELQSVQSNQPSQSKNPGDQFSQQQQEQQQQESDDSEQENSSEEQQVTQDQNQPNDNFDGGASSSVNETESVTDEAWSRNQEELVDERSYGYTYLNVPTSNLDNIIIDYKSIIESLKTHYTAKQKGGIYIEDWVTNRLSSYQKFKTSTVKTVNYLVKEFECKKAASQYSRASVSSTGVLNMSKLHTYKWNEDLFKKVTNLPDGKNHGLVMYLDWSGSMNSCILDTCKQLFNLVWFCKKVNIPFRVYAFTDNRASNYDYYENHDITKDVVKVRKDRDLYYNPHFRLLEFFSSKMNNRELEEQMKYVWLLANSFNSYGMSCPYGFDLCGTPLVEAILTSRDVLKKFKTIEKVEKLNVIFLTDGEANPPLSTKQSEYHKKNFNIERWNHEYIGANKLVVTDPVTRYSVMMNEYTPRRTTKLFIQFLRNIIDCNVIGFRIIPKREINWFLDTNNSNQHDRVNNEWRKTKSACVTDVGFNELYLIAGDNSLGADTEEIEVKTSGTSVTTGALTKAFKKHMGSKMTNKTILSKFIDQIA